MGPILMLSYKNHALDEFLMDVVKFHEASISRLLPGELIRTGKPESETLLPYCERNSPEERAADAALSRLLTIQRTARHISSTWLQCSSYLNIGILGDDQMQDQERDADAMDCLLLALNMVIELRCSEQDDKQEEIKPDLGDATSDEDENDADKAPKPANSMEAELLALGLLLPHNVRRGVLKPSLLLDKLDVSASKADTRTSKSPHFSQSDLLPALVKALPDWIGAVEHWVPTPILRSLNQRGSCAFGLVKSWFKKWLDGQSPPRRCAAATPNPDPTTRPMFVHPDQCYECATPWGQFCTGLHNCHSLSQCDQQRHTQEVKFCDSHRCHVLTENGRLCLDERLMVGKFCGMHACPGCVLVSQNGVINQKVGNRACFLHQCAYHDHDGVK